VQRCENDVLVVSIDRLTPMLRMAAGTVPPVFQSSRSRGFARAVEAKNRRAHA
jgi:hypothetical protein